MPDLSDEQALLDALYPPIAPEAPPPGRWAEDSARRLRRWDGLSSWRTRHGAAMILWDFGYPSRARGALLPTGARGDVGFTLDHGHRRPGPGVRRWIYGKLDIRPDDAVFTDGAQPRYDPPPPTDAPNLEADLAHDPAFLAAIADDRFARAVYFALPDRVFRKGTDPRPWTLGPRQTATLVAHLRDLGESYHDFYLQDDFAGAYPDDRDRPASVDAKLVVSAAPPDPDVAALESLHAHLARLGWHGEKRPARNAAQ